MVMKAARTRQKRRTPVRRSAKRRTVDRSDVRAILDPCRMSPVLTAAQKRKAKRLKTEADRERRLISSTSKRIAVNAALVIGLIFGAATYKRRLAKAQTRKRLWETNKRKAAEVMKKLWPETTGKKGRLKTLFSGQWADMPLPDFLKLAKKMGYEGVELACWHFDVQKALVDDEYVAWIKGLFQQNELQLVAISSHLVGQAVLDKIDARHKAILPPYVWGDGDPQGVNERAALEMMATARVAKRLGVGVVNGFVGSSIWHMIYGFPP